MWHADGGGVRVGSLVEGVKGLEPTQPQRRRRCDPGEPPCIPYTPVRYSNAIAEVAITGLTNSGVPWTMTHNVRSGSGSWTRVLLDALVQVFFDVVIPKLREYLTTAYRIQSITATQRIPSGAQSRRIFAPSIAGLIANESLPANNALAATVSSGQRGRSAQGGFYLPATAEGFNLDGIPTLQALQRANDYGIAVAQAASSANGNRLTIFSRKQGVDYPVSSIGYDARWDSQRNRLGKDPVN